VNTTGGTLRTTAAGSIGTGNLVVTQGNLELNHAAQSVGTVTLGATTATAPATIVMDAGTTFTLGGTLLYNDSTDNQAGTISGGTINLNGARTWTVDDSTGVDADLTVSSAVANSDGGAGTFTKNGLGRLVLNGNNTFANPLSVTDGILRIGHANALGSTAGATTVTSGEALELDGVGVTGETLNLNGVGFGGSTGALRNLSGTNSWTGTINLDGSARIHADAGTQLTVSAITAGGTSRNITFGGAGDLVASGKIGSGGANPVAQLIKAGTGLLTLSNTANDYTGGTVVNEGILRLGASDVIPNAGTVTVNASTGGTATLDLDDFSDTIAALTLGGTGGTATSVNQVLTGTGTLTLGGAVTVTATGDWTTAALISGKVDLGIASRTFSVNNSTGTDVDLHVDAPISGGAVGITKDLAGTMLLSGASTYGGTTTVRDGVLRLGINNALPATILTMDQRNGGTSTVDLGVFNATIGALTLSGGTTTVLGSLNQIIGSGVLTLGGAVTYNAGTASFHNGQATVSANVDLGAATRTFTINDSLATTTETVISGNISGTGAGLSKAGTGTLVLSGVNTYDGDTSISAGVLRAANNQAFGTTGTLSLANTDAVLELADGISVSRPTTVSNSGNNKVIRLLDGATTATFGGDITISETTAGNFDVSAETGGTLTLSGAIGGTGAAGLSKEGAGTVALSGANTFTGATTINAGTLQLGDGGTTGSLSTSSTITNNGTFSINRSNAVAQGTDFNGGGITGTGSLTQSGTGTTTLTAANTYTGTTTINAGTLQLGDGGTTGSLSTSSAITNNATFTINRSNTVVQGTDFSGTGISGSGNFVHAGTGTTTLSAANTYTGTTTVSAGKLVVTDAQALGTAAAGTTVASGASLELGTGLNYSTAESLTINGSGGSHGGALRGGSGPGTTTFAGAITAATDATIHSGGYILTLTGGIDKNGTVLTLTGGGTVNISGTGISGSDPDSDLVVDGTTVNLDVANTYNGPTYIRNGGVINANAANALPTASGRSNLILDDVGSGSSTLNLNSGIAQSVASLSGAASSGVALGTSNLTLGSASGSTTFAGTISGSTGGLIKDGASTQILAGANTYDGATTVSGGTLLLNGDQSAANGATTVASGATLGGTGTSGAVTTTIQSGGTLTGGTDGTISTLTFTDDLIAQSGSTWLVDIASGAADLIIANLIDLSGSPTLVVNDTGSWAAGQTWNIAQYTSSLSGMFASGATVVGSRGTTFTIDYSNGGFITLTSAVPEPSAVLVILFGLGALGFWRLRQGKGLAKAGDGIPAPARAED
jgi:autotransporter-associated beta strand protein